MQITVLKPSAKRWLKFLQSCSHDFYHTPGYVQLEADRLGGDAFAYLLQENDCFFFLPLILRKLDIHGQPLSGYEEARDAVSPYGYPGPLLCGPTDARAAKEFTDSAIKALLGKLAQDQITTVFVRLHPLMPVAKTLKELSHLGLLVHHGETVWIDLTLTHEQLRDQIRASYRNNISKLKRSGLVARMDESFAKLEDFVKIYHQTMDSVSAAKSYYFDYEYIKCLKTILGPSITLCWIEDSPILAVGGLFTECGGIVQYHLSGTNPETLFPDATKLMLAFVTGWAKERGNTKFHLGGGLGSQNDNLFFFKSGFSKLRADFHTWRVISNREIYEAAMAQWRKFSKAPAVDEKGFFPPYRLTI